MSLTLYILYTLLNLALFVWGMILWRSTRRAGTLAVTAVAVGLMYDNLILAAGGRFSGGLLYALSLPRFILHQLVLPWIILAAFEQVRLTGQAWAQPPAVRRAAVALTMIVVLLGVLTRLLPMNLQLVEMDGILRYVDRGAKGPPLVSILSIGWAGVMGAFLWRKNRWPWLALSAVLVFIGEGIPLEAVRRAAGSGAEVLFMAVLLIMEKRL